MENSKLIEIIKVQSKIIKILSDRYLSEFHYPPEKEEMGKLKKELETLIKGL